VKPSKAPMSPEENKENRGPTPSSSGSKASLLLNWEETTGLVVELILMNPKCESRPISSGREDKDPPLGRRLMVFGCRRC
jgi:hypothetical protein